MKDTLKLGGYSLSQAKKGMQVLRHSAPLRGSFERELERKLELAGTLPDDEQLAVLIKRQLLENMVKGELRMGSN